MKQKSIFFWNSLAFCCDPTDVNNLISGSSAFERSLNIWIFSVHILLKPSLENFEHYFASVWDEFNCVVVWMFFGIAFLWDWNETLISELCYFSSCLICFSFVSAFHHYSKLITAWVCSLKLREGLRRLKSFPTNQIRETQRGFVPRRAPQGPAQFQSSLF